MLIASSKAQVNIAVWNVITPSGGDIMVLVFNVANPQKLASVRQIAKSNIGTVKDTNNINDDATGNARSNSYNRSAANVLSVALMIFVSW